MYYRFEIYTRRSILAGIRGAVKEIDLTVFTREPLDTLAGVGSYAVYTCGSVSAVGCQDNNQTVLFKFSNMTCDQCQNVNFKGINADTIYYYSMILVNVTFENYLAVKFKDAYEMCFCFHLYDEKHLIPLS